MNPFLLHLQLLRGWWVLVCGGSEFLCCIVFVVGVCSFGFELEKICSGGAEEEEEEAEFQSLFGECGKRFKVERERERRRVMIEGGVEDTGR